MANLILAISLIKIDVTELYGRYPAEAHLVHKAEDGTAAVIAILFKYSNSTDPLLAKVNKTKQNNK